VITDLVMPQMSGREVIERMRQHTPDVKIICASGFIRTGADDEDTYLQKPFTSQDLLRKVKQATSGN
jgi:two-component system cell cycle sensor histidine kinase/response regulator CckA